MADWAKIKTEYITTDTSYRILADKYGLTKNAIAAVAGKEGWVDLRRQHLDSIVTKTIVAEEKKRVERMLRIGNVADRLLDKLESAVNELDAFTYKQKQTIKTESGETVTEYQAMDKRKKAQIDRAGIRQLASAMRDLKDVMMIQSDLDEQEQKAKISKLEHDTKKKGDVSITVQLDGVMEEFAQ